MSGGKRINYCKGFTLIEIMVAIVLIGLLATVIVPNFRHLQMGYDRKQFVSELNTLIGLAWQQAIATHETTRILFDFEHNRVAVQSVVGREKDEPVYREKPSPYAQTSYQIPERFQIKDCFIDGIDQMHRPGLIKIEEVWFFVFADGTTQEVILNIFDTADRSESDAGTRFSLVLNPFTVALVSYDTFQKP